MISLEVLEAQSFDKAKREFYAAADREAEKPLVQKALKEQNQAFSDNQPNRWAIILQKLFHKG